MPKLIGSNPSSIKQNKCEISRFEIKKDNPFYWPTFSIQRGPLHLHLK